MEVKTISRKEFIEQVGGATAAIIFAACLGSCKKTSNNNANSNASSVNFTVTVASGPLATNGGYLVQNNVIVARISSTSFVAVSSVCTHQGGTLFFNSSGDFQCPLHGATYDTNGNVLSGPAPSAVQKYNTSLSGTSLRVFS